MPLRVKTRPGGAGARDASPMSIPLDGVDMPDITPDDTFRDVIKKLSV
jgi:hypothetical protein